MIAKNGGRRASLDPAARPGRGRFVKIGEFSW
jgi:hypothetical protein